MNIAISGYTAVGKTTHARLLAHALGYDLVWAAQLLLEKLGFDLSTVDESQLWFHHHAEIAARRAGTDLDRELDGYLVQRCQTDERSVFDARFLPWLTTAPCIRVWLGSDLRARARKCQVSLGAGAPSLTTCAVHVHEKDHGDIARLARAPGVVFGPDPSCFDIILDSSSLVAWPGADPGAGIATLHRYLWAAVRAQQADTGPLLALREANGREFRDVVRFVRGVAL